MENMAWLVNPTWCFYPRLALYDECIDLSHGEKSSCLRKCRLVLHRKVWYGHEEERSKQLLLDTTHGWMIPTPNMESQEGITHTEHRKCLDTKFVVDVKC